MPSNIFVASADRINEGAHDSPTLTMRAYSVHADERGNLNIEGENLSRGFTAGLWESVTVKRVAVPREDDL